MSEAERFLFTGLPEAERQRLEEQILLDDELFEEVLAVEGDLLDAAARGEVDPEEEERLAHLPDLEQRLAFARQLARASAQHLGREQHRTPLRRFAPWLAAAALLWLTFGLGWLWLALHSNPKAEFVLRPTGLRGGGPELVIGEEAEKVELHLELTRSFKANRFAVLLNTKAGDEVERWEELNSERFAWGTAVVILVAAEVLDPGAYSAQLLELDADGAGKEAGMYSFTVVLLE